MPDSSASSDLLAREPSTPSPTTAGADTDHTPPPPRDARAAVEHLAAQILSSPSSPFSPFTPSSPSVLRLSDIEPEPVLWLSPGRLGIGKVTVLDGDPGLGKSTLLCEFAARITRGDPLPGGQARPPRGVILLSADDSLSETIRPRIDAAGGDTQRVVTIVSAGVSPRGSRPITLPRDIVELGARAIAEDAALIIIDPLAGFLGPRHTIADAAHLRHILTDLHDIADFVNVAVVVVRHLNKASGANPLYRGSGGIGIIGAARCGLLLAADPDEPTRRILAATKQNLTTPLPSLAFRLVTDPATSVARVVWDGESAWTATQLLAETPDLARSRSALLEARAWLRAALAAGPQPSKALKEAAAARGHTDRTLFHACRAEEIVVRKQPGRHGQWTWELPPPRDTAECNGKPG